MTTVRQSVLAGSWYPADPQRLRAEVTDYFTRAPDTDVPTGTPVLALIPHAGYRYSGPTAGKVVNLLQGKRYEAVFILAPSHRTPLERPALSRADAFATPLGEVPVATEIVAALAATGHYCLDDQAHAIEHAVEIQLPFLQAALPAATPIVPILVPSLSEQRCRAAARALDPWRNDRYLILVSSDLTHYGQDYGYVPFTEDIPTRLESLDQGAVQCFLRHDAAGLVAYGRETGITMCGLGAAALALDAPAPADATATLLDYTRSADREGDYSCSVSYAAAVFCVPAAVDTRPRRGPGSLTTAEREFLVSLAERAVAQAVLGRPAPDPAALAAESVVDLGPGLQQTRGAFVTLTKAGRLRGCIGMIESRKPLTETVIDSAKSAAIGDPRFEPVTPNELASLEVEVSALTPPRRISSPDEIELGRHGILLTRGENRAVFLPQVPGEQGWDLETTLSYLAQKAGLELDAWRQGCVFEVFEAELCLR